MNSPKILTLLGIGLLAAGTAPAATIAYDFQDTDKVSPIGPQDATTVYIAPDTNTFGSGITISAFTLEDRDAGQYSRFVDVGSGSTGAALGHGGAALVASFTVTIDSTVTVDFDDISFLTGIRWNSNSNAINVTESFYTRVGAEANGNVTPSTYTKNINANYLANPDNPQTVTLSGLTGLTDTTVTFSWAFSSNRNNNFSEVSSQLDDITLNGTIAPVPEPSSVALLGLGMAGLMIRRRR